MYYILIHSSVDGRWGCFHVLAIENSAVQHLTYKNVFFLLLLFCLFAFPRATPVAYGSSQARGLIGAVDTGLHQSHSNVESKLCLQSTPQLTATPDP